MVGILHGWHLYLFNCVNLALVFKAQRRSLSARALPVSCLISSTSCTVGVPSVRKLVKPDCRFAIGVGMLPRIPRQVGLSLSSDEAPVDCGDFILLRNRKRSLNVLLFPRPCIQCTTAGGYSVSTTSRVSQTLRPRRSCERDNVRKINLEAIHWIHSIITRPVAFPDSTRQRLLWASFTRPGKCLR